MKEIIEKLQQADGETRALIEMAQTRGDTFVSMRLATARNHILQAIAAIEGTD